MKDYIPCKHKTTKEHLDLGLSEGHLDSVDRSVLVDHSGMDMDMGLEHHLLEAY